MEAHAAAEVGGGKVPPENQPVTQGEKLSLVQLLHFLLLCGQLRLLCLKCWEAAGLQKWPSITLMHLDMQLPTNGDVHQHTHTAMQQSSETCLRATPLQMLAFATAARRGSWGKSATFLPLKDSANSVTSQPTIHMQLGNVSGSASGSRHLAMTSQGFSQLSGLPTRNSAKLVGQLPSADT